MRPRGLDARGDDRRGPVREKGIGDDLVGIPAVLMVQAAKLEAQRSTPAAGSASRKARARAGR